MGVLVFKFILWGILLSALWELVKFLFRAPVVVAAWAIERHRNATEEQEFRAASNIKMRDQYITQSIFLRIMSNAQSDNIAANIAKSKADGQAIHNRRVAVAMEQAKKQLTTAQLTELGL